MTDVEAGRAWRAADDEEGDDGAPVPFDDSRALWKTVHVSVAVDEVLGSADGQSPDQVLVSFTLDGDESLAPARDQLLKDQLLVLPLYKWAGTDHDPELWAVGPANGDLVAEVGADGSLKIPCVSRRTARKLLGDVPTLDALREAAAEPTEVRRLEPVFLG